MRGAEVIAVEVGDPLVAEGRDPQSARKEVLGGRWAGPPLIEKER